jgi:hypothetical protein
MGKALEIIIGSFNKSLWLKALSSHALTLALDKEAHSFHRGILIGAKRIMLLTHQVLWLHVASCSSIGCGGVKGIAGPFPEASNEARVASA